MSRYHVHNDLYDFNLHSNMLIEVFALKTILVFSENSAWQLFPLAEVSYLKIYYIKGSDLVDTH